MSKSLIRKVLGRFGYRLTRVPPDQYRRNPRFDVDDLNKSLAVVKQFLPSDIHWAGARKYLQPRRVSFYYETLDVLEAANLPLDGARVLDVGVFFGYMLRILHNYHPTGIYSGTDTNDSRIEIAKALCPFAKIWRGTIDSLEVGTNYDLIILTEVLEHLANPQVALQRLRDITTGYLLLTVPDGRYDSTAAKEYRSDWDGYTGHVNFWSLESWRHWLNRECPNDEIRTGKLPTGQLYAIVQKDFKRRFGRASH